jgi:hypothetical protein
LLHLPRSISHHILWKKHIISNDHCPHLCFRQGCFVDPSMKLTAAASTEAKRHVFLERLDHK